MTLTDTTRPTTVDERVDPRSARARLETLLDDATFRPAPGSSLEDRSGVLTGTGRIAGNEVVVYCSEATVQGGAMGEVGCVRIASAIEHAIARRVPVVGVWHSGGARLQEGVASLDAVGRVFAAMVMASGRVPQLSLVLGPAAGGAAYGPALTDLVVMGPQGRVFVTGPDVVRSVTGEDVDSEALGGTDAHGKKSGVVHVTTKTDAEAYAATRRLVDLLAHQGTLHLDALGDDPGFADLLPESPKRAYDVHPLVKRLLDADSVVELQRRWAPNMVTALGRLGGRTVGVLANNPLHMAGCLDSLSAEKSARFVRMCDAFGVPLVVLVDVPGYLPGVGQEWGGVVRRGAKLLHAFGESVVPRVTLVTRKAYGGAYIAMNSRALGASSVLAWPTAEVAVMGAVAAVRILHRRELAAAPEAEREALTARLAAEHERVAGGIERAREIGVVDAVVAPAHTRRALGEALLAAPARRGDHRNIPL